MSTSTNASAARTGPRRRCGTLAADERSWVSRACIQWTATLAGAIRRRGARRDGCEERVDARSSARARSLRTPTSRRPASSDYADPNALSQTSHITRDPPYHALRSIPLHERGEKTTMTRVEDASRASQPTAPPTASDPPADEQRLRPSFSVAPFFFFWRSCSRAARGLARRSFALGPVAVKNGWSTALHVRHSVCGTHAQEKRGASTTAVLQQNPEKEGSNHASVQG